MIANAIIARCRNGRVRMFAVESPVSSFVRIRRLAARLRMKFNRKYFSARSNSTSRMEVKVTRLSTMA